MPPVGDGDRYTHRVLRLERLRSDHADAVLAFETANRAFFSESISDRGDDYFERFAAHHRASLDEQETGVCAYFVLVDDDGAVLGRFNLYEIGHGTAEVGYRVAQSVSGRGVATEALGRLCEVARTRLSLRTLSARTSGENIASQRVLEKCGFLAVGEAEVGGRPGRTYHVVLEPSGD